MMELSPRGRRADPAGRKGAQGEGTLTEGEDSTGPRGMSGGRGEHSPRVRRADPDLSEETSTSKAGGVPLSGVSASFMSVTELGLAPVGELLATVEQGSLAPWEPGEAE